MPPRNPDFRNPPAVFFLLSREPRYNTRFPPPSLPLVSSSCDTGMGPMAKKKLGILILGITHRQGSLNREEREKEGRRLPTQRYFYVRIKIAHFFPWIFLSLQTPFIFRSPLIQTRCSIEASGEFQTSDSWFLRLETRGGQLEYLFDSPPFLLLPTRKKSLPLPRSRNGSKKKREGKEERERERERLSPRLFTLHIFLPLSLSFSLSLFIPMVAGKRERKRSLT